MQNMYMNEETCSFVVGDVFVVASLLVTFLIKDLEFKTLELSSKFCDQSTSGGTTSPE